MPMGGRTPWLSSLYGGTPYGTVPVTSYNTMTGQSMSGFPTQDFMGGGGGAGSPSSIMAAVDRILGGIDPAADRQRFLANQDQAVAGPQNLMGMFAPGAGPQYPFFAGGSAGLQASPAGRQPGQPSTMIPTGSSPRPTGSRGGIPQTLQNRAMGMQQMGIGGMPGQRGGQAGGGLNALPSALNSFALQQLANPFTFDPTMQMARAQDSQASATQNALSQMRASAAQRGMADSGTLLGQEAGIRMQGAQNLANTQMGIQDIASQRAAADLARAGQFAAGLQGQQAGQQLGLQGLMNQALLEQFRPMGLEALGLYGTLASLNQPAPSFVQTKQGGGGHSGYGPTPQQQMQAMQQQSQWTGNPQSSWNQQQIPQPQPQPQPAPAQGLGFNEWAQGLMQSLPTANPLEGVFNPVSRAVNTAGGELMGYLASPMSLGFG